MVRVKSLPNYNEPFAKSHLRKANPHECLSQMVAFDSDDPSLCARISPNAYGPLGDLDRSTCLKDIRAAHSPDLKDHVRYGAIQFQDVQTFRTVLKELGYPGPPPTPDYAEFYGRAVFDAPEKAEFIRRFLALKTKRVSDGPH